MLNDINVQVISMLLKCDIEGGQQNQSPRAAVPDTRREDFSKLKVRHDEVSSNVAQQLKQAGESLPVQQDEPQKKEPIKVGPKLGPNDPCFCGSGKKYKKCHGA